MTFEEAADDGGTDTSRYPIRQTDQVKHKHLLTCPYFSIEKIEVREDSYSLNQGRKGNPDVLIVANGYGTLETSVHHPLPLQRGDTVLIPSSIAEYAIRTDMQIQLLRTFY